MDGVLCIRLLRRGFHRCRSHWIQRWRFSWLREPDRPICIINGLISFLLTLLSLRRRNRGITAELHSTRRGKGEGKGKERKENKWTGVRRCLLKFGLLAPARCIYA